MREPGLVLTTFHLLGVQVRVGPAATLEAGRISAEELYPEALYIVFIQCFHPQVWLSMGKGGSLIRLWSQQPNGRIPIESEFLRRNLCYSADPVSVYNNIIKELCVKTLPGYDGKYNLHPG